MCSARSSASHSVNKGRDSQQKMKQRQAKTLSKAKVKKAEGRTKNEATTHHMPVGVCEYTHCSEASALGDKLEGDNTKLQITLNLCTLGGQMFPLIVTPESTVRSICETAASLSNVPSIMLVHNEVYLKSSDKTLKDAGISDNALLNMVVGHRYRGTIKRMSGSCGFVFCAEVAELYHGDDVFLHRREYEGVCTGRGQ